MYTGESTMPEITFTNLICLGDSITACNRFFDAPPLGNGYVKLLKERLQKENPAVSVTNFGFDGFTAHRLFDAVQTQGLLNLTENMLSVFIILVGINDIGLIMNTCGTEEQKARHMAKFTESISALIALLLPKAQEILLLEPFIFPCPQEYLSWLPLQKAVSDILKKTAAGYKLPYILLQNDFLDAADCCGYEALTIDGVHLTATGHEILAQKLWNVLSTPAQSPLPPEAPA
jgi:lysophospholipase L1-like esterase